MIVSRRLTLQLTPLLDLLLIVIFAQYMEVHGQQETLAVEAQAAIEERQQLQQRVDHLNTELHQMQEQVQKATDLSQQAQQKLRTTQEHLDRSLAQQRVVGELVVELFQIPPEEIARILQPGTFPQGTPDEVELQRLRDRFQELASQQPGRMIEHLLSYEEIRKRCDVWELYVDAAGRVSMTAGTQRLTFLIDDLASSVERTDAIVNKIDTWYRTLPQPKSLVIILLTYDRRSVAGDTQPVRRALPQLVSKLQLESGGRIRFEYADLGFRLD